MHCICRCTHARCTQGIYQRLTSIFAIFYHMLRLHRRVSVITRSPPSQNPAHQSLNWRPPAKDEVTPTHRRWNRVSLPSLARLPARCTRTEPSRAEPGRPQLSARLTGQMLPLRSRPQLARSVRLRVHPPPANGCDGYIVHARARQINKTNNKYSVHVRTHSPCGVCVCVCLCCCVVSTHSSTRSVRAATCLPAHQPAQPLLPINGVTSPCGYGLFSNHGDRWGWNAAPMHRCTLLLLQKPEQGQMQLTAQRTAGGERCSLQRPCARARACAASVGLRSLPHWDATPKSKFNHKRLN